MLYIDRTTFTDEQIKAAAQLFMKQAAAHWTRIYIDGKEVPMSEPETAPVQMPVAPDPEAREFRDRGMEADRQEFMGRKETVMSEPVPGPAPLPFPEDVGECLVCTNPDCNGATEGDEPRWSPLAISPQGRWKLEAGAWFHICSYGKFGEAVNPFAAEGP